ncbi:MULTISPECIES: ABC transporter permease [unclassified Parvimonas]|uniref:ABC transporter permease n=1 Tax=unclassified Parvimonas TaxID=1151464 RepID=UPI002B493351|nr:MULTISPECIES: ABC transporter permease [unclassified Parvimonas]MEB3025150.1 ABC transporter permease [Parvimonas sp. M13]MEB3089148.1 ABC transporter permease [Parvimonas sp. M20]
MNFKKYFIANQRVNFSQMGLLLISILFLPLLLSLFLGYTAGNKFNPSVHALKIKTEVVIEEEGFIKENLDTYFKNLEEGKVLKLVEKGKSDFSIKIPKGFFESIKNGDNSKKLQIKREKNTAAVEFEIIKAICNSLIKNDLKIKNYSELLANNNKDKNLAGELIKEIESKSIVDYKENIHNGENALTGTQYYSVIGLSFLFMTILSSIINTKKKELSAINKRLSLIPISTIKRELYSFFDNYISFFGISIIYIVLFKLIDSSNFSGNILLFALLNMVLLFLVMSVAQFIATIIKEEYISLVGSLFNMLPILLSGMIPFERIFGENSILTKLIYHNYYKDYFINPYINLIKGKSISEHIVGFATIVFISLVFLALSLNISKKREEY